MTPSEAMRRAIELSWSGYPAPNPRVGAVLVKDGEVVGEGFHRAAGAPHAEVLALQQAGEKAQGATLYVTLEPCRHHGRTPPCTEAIAAAGVAKVVFAVADPSEAAGGGAEVLRARGVEVEDGLLAEEAQEPLWQFLTSRRLGRAVVLLKAAMTLDGRIATRTGESRWVTGEQFRRRAHALRAEMGAVLVGAGTVVADNPMLTVREVEAVNQPLRIVLDLDGCVPPTHYVLADGRAPTWHVRRGDLPMRGEEFDLHALCKALANKGMTGVLVEGGGRTIESFLRQGVADRVELHVAPLVFGSGTSWAEGEGVARIQDAWRLGNLEVEPLADGFIVRAEVLR
ncbi:MAG: bifunctional diaminohydroxyphosphoribosylaminopyrimidine deaminase/5-amino-6-(5-phosphoribosylamino)uracil reductase RibD [Armatimonadota bacterium]